MLYSISEVCVGCTLCARNCPSGAITGSRKNQHSIDKEICIDCGTCWKNCPTGAILDGDGEHNGRRRGSKKKVMRTVAVIDPDKCVGCQNCVPNCGSGEFSIDFISSLLGGHCEIDISTCVGCQTCVNLCPSNAIHTQEVAS